jgi:hypothetical protein
VPEKKQPARTCKKASDGKPQKKSASKEGRAREERGRPKDSSKGFFFEIQKKTLIKIQSISFNFQVAQRDPKEAPAKPTKMLIRRDS